MFYEPKSGHGLPHDPFKAIVAPRPIGWVVGALAAEESFGHGPKFGYRNGTLP